MTPEKLLQIGNFLRSNELSFNQLASLNSSDLNYLLSYLTPQGPFSDEQRYWLRRWFLKVTEPQVNEINSILPSTTRAAPLEYEGQLYLSSDLLSDSTNFGAVHSILKNCPLIYIEPADLATYRELRETN